jgi:putative acetyltransferase
MQKLQPKTGELIIRPEKAKDLPGIHTLLSAAFHGVEESELVVRLRSSSNYVPGLALVAEYGNEIRGYVMLTHVSLQADDGRTWSVLALGPIAVAPAHQQSGIGTMLMRKAIELADEQGEPLVVLLGHETYYPRFGFQRASQHGVIAPRPWPDANYMVLPLRSYSSDMRGTISYSADWRI